MRAIVRSRYGGPEVLQIREVEAPTPGAGEALVRVRASSVNMADVDYVLGRPKVHDLPLACVGHEPGSLASTWPARSTRPDPTQRVSSRVTASSATSPMSALVPGLTEYVAVPESALTPIPDSVSYEVAGATPSSGVFGIQCVRDKRPVQAGDRVLVNGASGNVGPYAVQIAKAYGAEVTGVCRTEKMAMVRAIGADHVIDYTAEDFRASGERYDLIIDVAARGGAAGIRRSLNPGGRYVVIGGNGRGYLEGFLLAPFVGLAAGRKMGILMWRVNDPKDMANLAEMLADGRIRPNIDRTYPLEEAADALAYVQSGAFQGKVLIGI